MEMGRVSKRALPILFSAEEGGEGDRAPRRVKVHG
jgi:hypothetical protein